jgi:transcriptional regulator with XRE-family HTH domain
MTAMATEPRLGTRIRRARERRRWTQQQLADRIGVNRKTVDNWENDRSAPRNSIGVLEEALGVSLGPGEPDGESLATQMRRKLGELEELVRIAEEQERQQDGRQRGA